MPGSLILDTVTRVVFHTIGLFSLYLLFAGHNAPGGGFVGGLVAGAALVLIYAGRGSAGVRSVLALRPERLLGSGLLLAGLTGALSWARGEPFLDSSVIEASLPLLGKFKVTSVLAFDTGVYLVVLGLVLAVMETLGAEEASS
jgi:multicomponent Na+:H+ antiporter subunit A